jgi:hypothetical protein
VPGLTLPNSAAAHSAMESMGMDGGGSMDKGSGGEMSAPMPR